MAEESERQSFCTNCGAQIPSGAGFCPSCGTRVGGLSAGAAGVGLDLSGGPVLVQFLGTGLQALGYGLIAIVLGILIIPYGWAVSLLSGWFVNNLAFSDGRTATFTGRGSQIWGYYILIFVLSLLTVIPIVGFIIYLLLGSRSAFSIVTTRTVTAN